MFCFALWFIFGLWRMCLRSMLYVWSCMFQCFNVIWYDMFCFYVPVQYDVNMFYFYVMFLCACSIWYKPVLLHLLTCLLLYLFPCAERQPRDVRICAREVTRCHAQVVYGSHKSCPYVCMSIVTFCLDAASSIWKWQESRYVCAYAHKSHFMFVCMHTRITLSLSRVWQLYGLVMSEPFSI